MTDVNVVMVTGCPRSGTTAVFKWLSLLDVNALNEYRVTQASSLFVHKVLETKRLGGDADYLVNAIRDLVLGYFGHKSGERTVLLKEPLIQVHEDFIEHNLMIFPNMKIVFMVRHPVNVLNSMVQRKWGMSMNGVTPRDMSIEEGVKIWKRSVQSFIENSQSCYLCSYERLVREPKEESERILGFIDDGHISAFVPEGCKSVSLSKQEVQNIMEETKVERELLGYN